MNSINITGRITKDLELRTSPSGKPVCDFSLAVNRIGQEQADFINCVVWNGQAENLCKYQSKGSFIGVTGALRVDTYKDKEGKTRYKTYVLANNVEYLESKKQDKPTQEKTDNEILQQVINEEPKTNGFAEFASEIEITSDDLPF